MDWDVALAGTMDWLPVLVDWLEMGTRARDPGWPDPDPEAAPFWVAILTQYNCQADFRILPGQRWLQSG